MAQILKTEVKENIDAAALKCFAEKGYKKTTMKAISEEARYSVDNLYRYYHNKDDLFYSTVTPGFASKQRLCFSDS